MQVLTSLCQSAYLLLLLLNSMFVCFSQIVPGTCCKLSNDNWRQPEPVDNDRCQEEARTIFNNPESTAETTQLYSDVSLLSDGKDDKNRTKSIYLLSFQYSQNF